MTKKRLATLASLLFVVGSAVAASACAATDPTGAGGAGGVGGAPGEYLPGFTPVAANPKECPPGAPANPLGSCIGKPVYMRCEYMNGQRMYACTCDWVHWICI